MSEIKIDLELRLSKPDKELNVNSLVFVLKENMANISFELLQALLHGVEERTISELQQSWPAVACAMAMRETGVSFGLPSDCFGIGLPGLMIGWSKKLSVP